MQWPHSSHPPLQPVWSWFEESRRPVDSEYHVNYFQRNPLPTNFIRGVATVGGTAANTINVELSPPHYFVVHSGSMGGTAIDQDPLVQGNILNGFVTSTLHPQIPTHSGLKDKVSK